MGAFAGLSDPGQTRAATWLATSRGWPEAPGESSRRRARQTFEQGRRTVKILILCGGKGVRAFPFSEFLPKPMMPVAGSPILLQVMRTFMRHGFNDFLLAAGHRKGVLDDYFEGKEIGAKVQILDTGESANTGDRVLACREHLGDRFFVAYGDGLADVALDQVLAYHAGHSGLATLTCVPLYSQYGVVDFDANGRVQRIREKPVMREHWMNAGYFVFDSGVFDRWRGNDLEREILPALIEGGHAYAYQHYGFWKSMDSFKDQQEFEELIEGGAIPWVRAPDARDARRRGGSGS